MEVTLDLQTNAKDRKLGLTASIHKCGLPSLAALTFIFWKKDEISERGLQCLTAWLYSPSPPKMPMKTDPGKGSVYTGHVLKLPAESENKMPTLLDFQTIFRRVNLRLKMLFAIW